VCKCKDGDNNTNAMHNKKTKLLLGSNLSYVDDCYLLKAKFTNYSNFFVCEVWREKGMLLVERSLEIAEVLQGGGRS